MAILTAGNDAIDMREPDWGLTPWATLRLFWTPSIPCEQR